MLQTIIPTYLCFHLSTRIKIKIVESMKSFSYIVSMISGVVVDDEDLLQEYSKKFSNVINNDSITSKQEIK